MKNLILFSLISLFTLSLGAQERTVNLGLDAGHSYYFYNGVAADTLVSTNQDTIDFVLTYRGDKVEKVAVQIELDPTSGNDTTITAQLSGKEFSGDSYTEIIAATTSSDVNSANTFQVISSAVYNSVAAHNIPFNNSAAETADTLKVPAYNVTPLDQSYRFYRLRLIITGASAAGSGITIDDVEWKFYN